MFKEGKKSKLKQLKRLNKAKHFSRQSYSIKNQPLLLKRNVLIAQKLKVVSS